jgi:general secretion pathway protein L
MEPASPDLRQRLRAASRRVGLTAFWRWWAGELVPLVPHKLRNAVGRMRLRPLLAFGDSVAVLWVPEVSNSHLAYKEAARVPLAGDQDATAAAGSAAIEALTRSTVAGRAKAAQVVVALPANQVLRKMITLPAAVEDNLAQVLAYDLDRHTPFKPEEVCFDAVIVGRDSARRELRVDWAAALKSVVEQTRRRAESWGASVIAVTPDSPGGGPIAGGRALNLLPEALRPDTSSRRRWQVWAPVALLVVAALFATALPLWQKRGYAIALMQQANQGRVQADASSALREQLERLTGDYNFALSKKYAYPSALQSVEDVTKLLPDDTWLTQLEMKSSLKGKEAKREIMVRGESANAGRLVSLFEESKLFGETAPRSPTTKIQPGPGEIFDLGAQLKPLPPPPVVQVATAAGTGSVTPAPPVASPVPAATVAPALPAKGDEPVRADPLETPEGGAPATSAPDGGPPPAASAPPVPAPAAADAPSVAAPPASAPPAAAPRNGVPSGTRRPPRNRTP